MGDRLEIAVLGPVRLQWHGTELAVPRLLERALAVRLALAGGAPIPDGTLVRELWGEQAGDRPAPRLRVLASRLRAAIGPAASALSRGPGGYALAADVVDAPAAQAALGQARAATGPAATRAAAERGLAQWRGDAFTDLHPVPFAADEAERWAEVRLDLQVARLTALLDLGEAAAARVELDELARRHPLHERLVGLLALALFREGRQAEALERLGALRRRLADDLGVDPTPETVALELRILRQDVVAAAAPPAVEASRLPAPTTPFIGREAELAGLVDRLAGAGVTTLVGPPGAGKTRLAVEAARLVHAARRRVVWTDLAPLPDPRAVLAAVAAGAGAQAADEPDAELAAALGDALLVLDNAEHVVERVAAVVAALHRAAPSLTVLVTSQRPLLVSGEEVWSVGPLAPEAAARLFCARSGLVPDDRVTAVCAAVDRLALGIELAAGLTRTLTLDQLAARMGERLRLLVGGARDAGLRHTSLRAALDWSYTLLPPGSQAVLRRLSVFAGGCPLEAAEIVAAGDGVEVADVAPTLVDLVERSLVSLVEDGPGRRFLLLESVREYAADRLRESGEAESTLARHLRWCRGHVAAHDVQGEDEASALRAIFAEWPNLVAALDRAPGTERSADALRLAVALDDAWMFRGLVEPARRHYAELVDAPGVDAGERARALSNYGFATALAGETELAVQLLERAERAAERAGDPELRMRVLYHRGVALVEGGRPVDAEAPLRASEELADRLGRPRSVAAIRDVRATALLYAGDVASAVALHHASNDVDRAEVHLHGLVRGLVNEASACLAAGDLDRSHACVDEAARHAAELEDTAAEANLEQLRGRLAAAAGDLDAAVGHLRAALAQFSADRADTRTCRLDLADALLRDGATAAAREQLAAAEEATSDRGVAWLLAQPTRAALAAATGDVPGALGQLRAAEDEYAERGFGWPLAIERLERVRRQLAAAPSDSNSGR